MRMTALFNSIVFTFALLLGAFSLMHYLDVPVGRFSDWLFALISIFWLLTIVTVPWNIHFKARQVLADAGPSRERGLPVNEEKIAYVRKLAKGAFWIAIALHVGSAVVLLVLAMTGVSRFGYVASILALLLTALRPAADLYDYLAERLRAIGEEIKYPREDVVELRSRVSSLESNVDEARRHLDLDSPESLASIQRTQIEDARDRLARLTAEVEQMEATNDVQHQQLRDETRSAVSQISTDGQFLDHVREIIRFFKTA